MTTIETATGCRITVGPKGLALWDRSAHLIGYELSTPLTADERRALVAALNPGQGGQWTRDDLPRIGTPDPAHDSVVDGVLDTVVHWLNKHHPKPQPYDQGGVRGADSLLYRAERERDAAVARAEQAERERDEAVEACALFQRAMHKWRERAEQAEARTAPAVTRADIEECVYGSRRAGRECDEQGFVPVHVQEAVGQLCDLFGVEAEQAVDPVEAKARELYEVSNPGTVGKWETIHEAFKDGYRRMAAHVLGQEVTR